jgi:hypothetical protein
MHEKWPRFVAVRKCALWTAQRHAAIMPGRKVLGKICKKMAIAGCFHGPLGDLGT